MVDFRSSDDWFNFTWFNLSGDFIYCELDGARDKSWPQENLSSNRQFPVRKIRELERICIKDDRAETLA